MQIRRIETGDEKQVSNLIRKTINISNTNDYPKELMDNNLCKTGLKRCDSGLILFSVVYLPVLVCIEIDVLGCRRKK